VQTTLLGLGIAIILALVTALVGPAFVDWGNYRGEFEARARQLTGLDFRVTGGIDARLLPTPTLMLEGIEFGRRDEASKVRARALRIEFSLAALVRGEWRIADARLAGPEFTAGLDSAGRVAWPLPKVGFDLEGVSIERLHIEDGRATLVDAASDSRVVLDKLQFNGELRSLAGPVKGDGAFVVGGHRHPYRVSVNRISEDGAVKVRLMVDSSDRPLTAEADVQVFVERGSPRFEGSISLARPVGRAPAGAQSLVVDSWRVSSRIKGDGTAAVLDQIEFQYGPDDRAIKLKGSANLTFGRQPEMRATLSSPQIDLDRVLTLPEGTRRPLPAISTLAEFFVAATRLPIPATVSVAVESVTLGGATLTRVGADMKTDADGLDIKMLELRAPGAAQLRLSGRLGTTATGVRFAGSTRLEANDPRAFMAWLTERSEERAVPMGPLRFSGDVTLGDDAIALDRLKLEFDRMTVAGRFSYGWPKDDRPARFDAALSAPDLDLDRVRALAAAMTGDAVFKWPREGALSLKLARALVAGVEAKQADVTLRADANGLEIERFTIADLGGATVAVKGRIDSNAQSPRGALSLDLDARALDGLVAVLEKFSPSAADQMRRAAGRLTPATIRASLAVDPGAAGTPAANAKFKIDGRAGSLRIALQGDAVTAGDAFKLENLAALGTAKVDAGGRLDTDDGAALVELLGLDRFIAADKKPGRLTLTAKGPLDGDVAVEGQLGAGSLAIAGTGTVRVSGSANPTAVLTIKVANANVRSLRSTAGRPAEFLPTSGSARLNLADGTLKLTDIAGTVAGTNVAGRVAVGLQSQPISVDGDIEVGAVDLPAALALALGVPAQSAVTSVGTGGGASAPWPSEPFEQSAVRLNGQVAVKAARVALTPKLAARDVRSVMRFGESEVALQAIDGGMAGGRLDGEMTFTRRAEGLTARTRVRLAGANAAELLPGDGLVSGRLTLEVATEGTGMSAVALIGALEGSGTFKLENGRVVRLDPAAFDAVIRAVDQGLPIDVTRVRDRMDAALGSGVLAVPLAEGAITITAGYARLGNAAVRAQSADLAVSGSVNLAESALDARLTLFGIGGAGAPANTRPEVMIALRGPIDTPKRSLDVAALASWLALRAVEQQSKKLDVLEGRAPLPAPIPAAVTPTPPVPKQPAAAPAAPAATQTVPDESAPRPTAGTQPATPSMAKPKPAVPAGERAPPLPPPIDIRPAPAPRAQPGAAGAHGAPVHAQPQKPATVTVPPRPRSLSEILFGN
jgi:uncharacterized protein involved in outer membrane biogenesis